MSGQRKGSVKDIFPDVEQIQTVTETSSEKRLEKPTALLSRTKEQKLDAEDPSRTRGIYNKEAG